MIVTKSGSELRYCGHYAAGNLLFASWPTHLISIANPDSQHVIRPAWFLGPVLELEFRDTRDPTDPDAPGVLAVKAVREFVTGIPGESKVLITCPGGYSRSAAAAVLIAILLGESPEEAFAQLGRDNAHATPNPVFLMSADVHLDLEGQLVRCWRSWLLDQGLDAEWFAPLTTRRRRR